MISSSSIFGLKPSFVRHSVLSVFLETRLSPQPQRSLLFCGDRMYIFTPPQRHGGHKGCTERFITTSIMFELARRSCKSPRSSWPPPKSHALNRHSLQRL